MSIWSTIRGHANVASGNFNAMFQDVAIPALPAAVSRLLEEINKSEPDVKRLAIILSSDPEIVSQVLRTVNSALYSPKQQIVSIQLAITLLGLQRVNSLVLAYATYKTLPEPETDLFCHQTFWTDSLLRAILAKELTARVRIGDEDLAFTAMLLADMALPVLLTHWQKYYQPVVYAWCNESGRLSDFETRDFGWNHGDAGSWILNSWGFPDDLVYMVGAHNLSAQRLQELELENTIALPLSIASLLPSVAKEDSQRRQLLWTRANNELSIQPLDWPAISATVKESFNSICQQFGVSSQPAEEVLFALAAGTDGTNFDDGPEELK